MTQKSSQKITFSRQFAQAEGPIPETLMNDLVFHSTMQQSNAALKGLLCALLGLSPEEVREVVLINPIDYRAYTDKEIILDVRVIMNSSEIINVELMSGRYVYWIPRSLLYLCRSYDSIGAGDDYRLLKPTTHISILNFTLFPDRPEFYGKYLLSNVKNHAPYTKHFALNVLDLTRADLATPEEISFGLVHWAEAFNATTWQELRSIAVHNEALKEVAETMYTINADVSQRSIAEAHRKFVEIQTTLLNDRAALLNDNDMLKSDNDMLKSDNDMLKNDNDILKNDNAMLQSEKATLQNEKVTLQNEKVTLQNEKVTLQNDNAMLRNEKARAEKKLAETEEKLAEAEGNAALLAARDRSLSLEVERFQKQLAELQGRLAKYESVMETS